MIVSFLVGFGIGLLIGAVLDLVIYVCYERLTAARAKQLASEKAQKRISKIFVQSIKNDREIGEVIDVKAFDDDNNHVANITFKSQYGSTMSSNRVY